jgi:hypothetical protein
MLDIDVYFYPIVTNAYYDSSAKNNTVPSSFKWITADIQTDNNNYEPLRMSIFMNQSIRAEGFTTLWDWKTTREPMNTITAVENTKLSQEEQIYIQCSPAGASEQTQMVNANGTGGRGGKKGKFGKRGARGRGYNESANMTMLIITMIVIFVNIFVVGFGYKMIFKFLSKFFVRNVIENRYSKHGDKRRSAFEMFVFWVIDLVPHFFDMQWGEENVRTISERLIRIYIFLFYGILFFTFLFATKYHNVTLMHLSLFLIILLVLDIFLFFLQIRNLSQVNYEALKI